MMKVDALIFAALIIATILILLSTAGNNAIDVPLHDTYIVLDNLSVTVLIIGPLTFLTFFFLGLARKFKTLSTNVGFIVGLALVAIIFFQVAQFQTNFRAQMHYNSAELQLTEAERERIVNDLNSKVIFTWGLFGACMVGIGLTSFWTYRLSKSKSIS